MLDQRAIDELRIMVGAGFNRVIETFLKSSEDFLLKLTAAVQAEDKEAIRRIAHGFRSVCGQLGASSLETLIGQLEEHALYRDIAFSRNILELAQQEYQEASAELKQLIS